MSSNPDELKHNEIDYIQYLYYKLYDTYLLNSISYIIELNNQELIATDKPKNKVSILIDKKLNNIPLEKFLEIRSLLKDKVFKYFSDIVKLIPQEGHVKKIYKKIIISDLYYFIPLIIELIKFYNTYLKILHKICAEFILKINKANINLTTNNMFLNALNSTYFSIILLEQLLHFIKTREIKKELIEKQIDFREKQIKYINTINTIDISTSDKYNYYLYDFKRIISYFSTKKTYPIIDIINFIDYLHKYIEYNNNIITVENNTSNILYLSFIKHINMLLITYFTKINKNIAVQYIDYNNLNKLFNTISSNDYQNDKLIALLKKIISSISIMNANFYNYYQQKEGYILYGIIIIILLNKLIEYLYCKDFIITYNPKFIKYTFTKYTFLQYIKDEIYPSINFNITGRNTINEDISIFFTNSPSNRKKPSIRRQHSIRKQPSIRRQFSIRPKSIIDNSTKNHDILIFIKILQVYVLNFFYEVMHIVNNVKLNDILYENNNNEQGFIYTLLYENIISLFKNISNKIKFNKAINDSIFYLLKYIIDLTINICIILVKLRNFNKILLKGIVNINLLNKLINFLKSPNLTPITYGEYDYTNIAINTSKQHVMNFLLDNNIEYDLTTDIIKLNDNKIDEIEIYNKINTYIMTINHQYNYSGDTITVFGGGHSNKYKKTENKITVIYKKKEYTRVIYICERKKYIKINKTYMLLSKFKKI